MSGWQPIETAPKPSKSEAWEYLVDIWIYRPKHKTGYRIPDARYDINNDAWIDQDGKWVTGRHFRDEEGDNCFDPSDKGDEAKIATHWRPRPDPPSEDAG